VTAKKAAPAPSKSTARRVLVKNPHLSGFSVYFPDDQQETEDDLVGAVSYREAVVTNTDWTIESIYLQMSKGTVDLQPSFQRRSAWDDQRKSRLIESIIVGMPVPNLVLAEDRQHRGRFIVIDGKQRLIAIQDFIEGKYKLSGLDMRRELDQKWFRDLDTADQSAFENSTIRTTLIKNWRDEKFLWAAFYRLNVGSLPLSPQELRKALIGGKLLEAIEHYLMNSEAFQSIFGDTLDKRMRDSELVLRFLAFDRDYGNYAGDFKKFLDGTAKYFEDDWEHREAEATEGFERLDRALITSYKIFGEDVFKKWLPHGDMYERVMNRAVFDCMVRYFAEDNISKIALKKRPRVVQAYKVLCDDRSFLASIERSTKTVTATDNRMSAWGKDLADTLGMDFDKQTMRLA